MHSCNCYIFFCGMPDLLPVGKRNAKCYYCMMSSTFSIIFAFKLICSSRKSKIISTIPVFDLINLLKY